MDLSTVFSVSMTVALFVVAAVSLWLLTGPRRRARREGLEHYDGVWRGAFVEYDASGAKVRSVHVRAVLETIEPHIQRVRWREESADAIDVWEGEIHTVITDTGELELLRKTSERGGDKHAEHRGRVIPPLDGGGVRVLWHRLNDQSQEVFLDWIRGPTWEHSASLKANRGATLRRGTLQRLRAVPRWDP